MLYLRILAVAAAWGFLGYAAIMGTPIPLDPECLAQHSGIECSYQARAMAHAEGLTLFP